MLASKSTCGFYDPFFHTSIPDDVVEISAETHAELLAGESQGKVITWGDDGYPELMDAPPPSSAQVAAIERVWRDGQLAATDGAVARHRDEVESQVATTLSAEQYRALQTYRLQLRDWPQSTEFPMEAGRPVTPPLLSGQVQ
jgi:hypothetical protein